MTDAMNYTDELIHSIIEVKIIRIGDFDNDNLLNDHIAQGWKILTVFRGYNTFNYHLGRPDGIARFQPVDHRTSEELPHDTALEQTSDVQICENKQE